MSHALLLAIAMGLDAWLGEPKWLWDRVPHPAVMMGRLIGWADKTFNTGAGRRTKGVILLAVLVMGAWGLGSTLAALPGGMVIEVVLAAILLAQKSLVEHVADVAKGLRLSTDAGREMVARIVGRDTAALDGPGISRAAIESAAENFSDGVVAPAFWFLIGGLPGLLIYKVTNTADSMIGYRTPRHEAFGWAAARFDDLLNLIPARLTAAIMALRHPGPGLWGVIRRDARLHRSPNAGWPEAAMAVTLDVSLSGPRSYDGQMKDFPWVWAPGSRTPGPDQIDGAVTVLWQVWRLMLLAVVILSLV